MGLLLCPCYRQRALPSPSLLQRCPPLHRLLPSQLVLVELGKVVDNDGDGQGDDEDAAYAAGHAHDLPDEGVGHHVPVAHGGNRDGGPPESVRDRGELRGQWVG